MNTQIVVLSRLFSFHFVELSSLACLCHVCWSLAFLLEKFARYVDMGMLIYSQGHKYHEDKACTDGHCMHEGGIAQLFKMGTLSAFAPIGAETKGLSSEPVVDVVQTSDLMGSSRTICFRNKLTAVDSALILQKLLFVFCVDRSHCLLYSFSNFRQSSFFLVRRFFVWLFIFSKTKLVQSLTSIDRCSFRYTSAGLTQHTSRSLKESFLPTANSLATSHSLKLL